MGAEEKIKLAKKNLSQAEAQLDVGIHTLPYNYELCRHLSENVRTARDRVIDQLSSLFPEE
jgi:hypothetical protein